MFSVFSILSHPGWQDGTTCRALCTLSRCWAKSNISIDKRAMVRWGSTCTIRLSVFNNYFQNLKKRTYLYALFFKQRKAKYPFKEVSIVEEWTPAGAGGGEHEQRAEGDEEQDQGEQEEIHGVYDFLKIFSSNINFVYSIWRKCCSCFEKFRSALSNYLV